MAIPLRDLVRFAAVGTVGLFVNTLLLALVVEAWQLPLLLAALVATQGSSAWNFAGTEWWVFGHRRRHRARLWRRLLGFLALNNGALLLRGPLLLALVALQVNYLWANLATLVLMMLLRFVIADRFIWKRSDAPPAPTFAADAGSGAAAAGEGA